jgi:diguanylate cyclase (GGDEF)-like protein
MTSSANSPEKKGTPKFFQRDYAWRQKKHIVLVISLLLVGGFLATALATYYVSRESLRAEIVLNELPLTSDNIYSEIQRDLILPIFISSLMAHDTFLRDWIIEGEKNPDKVTRYLREIQEKYNTLTSFFVSEKTRTYYQAKGILKKVKPDEPRDVWYFRVRKMPAPFEINIDPDMANKDKMTIFVNFKVFDYNKDLLGAAGIGLEIKAVRQLIETYQKRYRRNIFFVNKDGDITLEGSSYSGDTGNIRRMEGLSGLVDKILNSDKSSLSYQKNGDTIHLNTRYIPEFHWYLLVEQSESATMQDIHRIFLINIAICIVITIIILIITDFTISTYQNKIEKLAVTDKLTGLFNRHGFDVLFSQIMKEAPRRKLPFSVILFDIDHYKKVNDSFGHTVGDNVLKYIVRIVLGNVREEDICCRWGGDEFLLLLKDCPISRAQVLAEKIRNAVTMAPLQVGGKQIELSLSLGVTEYGSGETGESLFKRVDQLLYLAKQNGRNRVEKGSPTVG